MINNQNVSKYNGKPPVSSNADGIIYGGPLYAADEILPLCKEHSLFLWPNAALDARKWNLQPAELCSLIIKAVNEGNYLNSQWCIPSPKGPWAACDGYSVYTTRYMITKQAVVETQIYFKFAINKKGTGLLVISNHPEDESI
jgi:hypothetical protein